MPDQFFFNQPPQVPPANPTLQDELAKRYQAEHPSQLRDTIDSTLSGLRGFLGVGDDSHAARGGELLGAMIPFLPKAGVVHRMGSFARPLETTSLMEAANPTSIKNETHPAVQKLTELLGGFNAPEITPEYGAKLAADSRVTNTWGHPPASIRAPEGVAFGTRVDPYTGKPFNVRSASVDTPNTRRYEQWNRSTTIDENAKPKADIPVARSIDEARQLAASEASAEKALSSERKLTIQEQRAKDGIVPQRQRLQSNRATTIANPDLVKNIRSKGSLQEAQTAHPNINPETVRSIYNRETWGWVKDEGQQLSKPKVPTSFPDRGPVAAQARNEAFDRVANRNNMAQNVVGNTPGSTPNPRIKVEDDTAPTRDDIVRMPSSIDVNGSSGKILKLSKTDDGKWNLTAKTKDGEASIGKFGNRTEARLQAQRWLKETFPDADLFKSNAGRKPMGYKPEDK